MGTTRDAKLDLVLRTLEEVSISQSSLQESAKLALRVHQYDTQHPFFSKLARESCEAVFIAVVAAPGLDEALVASYRDKICRLHQRLKDIDTFATISTTRSRLAAFLCSFSDDYRLRKYRKFMHGFIIDPDFNPKLRSKRTTSNRLPQSNESPQSNEPPEPIEHEDDRGPLEMFSGASEFTVLGGQYNVVRGNQVNLGGPHMIIYPSIQFNTGFRPDQFTIDGIPIFLYQQLLDFASSLDMFIVQLLLLLAYRSFETQIIQLLSHAPLYQLVN